MIEYVMGETMEIYLAVLFLWLITGLTFLDQFFSSAHLRR
jgi:hypothetical protein